MIVNQESSGNEADKKQKKRVHDREGNQSEGKQSVKSDHKSTSTHRVSTKQLSERQKGGGSAGNHRKKNAKDFKPKSGINSSKKGVLPTKKGESTTSKNVSNDKTSKAKGFSKGSSKVSDSKGMQKISKTLKTEKLSEHFTIQDFSCKCGSCKGLVRLSLGLVGGLELLCAKVATKITIVQAFCCPDSPLRLGSIKRNYFSKGLAAKIKLENSNLTLKQLFLKVEEVEEFKGIGLLLEEGVIHVDTRKDQPRFLWIEEKKGKEVELLDSNRMVYFSQERFFDNEDDVISD